MNKTVVVGMSGGVDSSVCAYLLKEEGYNVIGATMKIWQDDNYEAPDGGCCGLSAVDDARRVANKLDIPYYVLNFKKDFKENVIDYFIAEYLEGRTPNPCIACNRYVKWESLLRRSKEIGADFIATGHYAKVVNHPETGRFTLKISDADGKDQTYALYNLTQDQLEHTLMPVGNYPKDQIREIAKKIDLSIASKPDSQEICFVPDNNYAGFIETQTNKKFKAGNFVDLDGNILAKHKGIHNYTVGQRKGLGVAFGKPMYVHNLNVEKNEVVLCDNENLFNNTLYANNLNFMSIDKLDCEMKVFGKIRYSQIQSECTISMENDNTIKAVFNQPQRAITPGQAVVFYDHLGYVVGGGTIISSLD